MEPWEWDEAALKRLIDDEVPESVEIEYKGSDALRKSDSSKKTELSKDVSAMTNSAGGTIVYGIATHTDPSKKHLPECLDNAIDPQDITAEWIEQVIYSNVHPRIEGLRINQVQLHTARPGRVAYVVYVPPSYRGHQAADKRYYSRIELTTTMLEDYQVRDLLNRACHPVLEPEFSREDLLTAPGDHWYRLKATIRNNGPVAAQRVALDLKLPKAMVFEGSVVEIQRGSQLQRIPNRSIETLQNTQQIKTVIVDGKEYLCIRLENVAAQASNGLRSRIIFPGDEIEIAGENGFWQIFLQMADSIHSLIADARYYWTLFADNSPRRDGSGPISDLHCY